VAFLISSLGIDSILAYRFFFYSSSYVVFYAGAYAGILKLCLTDVPKVLRYNAALLVLFGLVSR